jgi:iduronate 2-sulfatase
MNMLKHLAATVAGLLSLTTAHALATTYDVYLLAGQSNMDGRGAVADLTGPLARYAQPQPEVRFTYGNSTLRQKPAITSGGWTILRPGYAVGPGDPMTRQPATTTTASTAPSTAPSTNAAPVVPGPMFGPEIGFAQAVTDAGLPAGHRLALIKFTLGGTDLRQQWNPASRGLLYDQFIAFTKQALADLSAHGDTYTVQALLWHQGESDAKLPPERYQALLTSLINSTRHDLNLPNLPVVLGEPYDNGHRLSIRLAQRATAKALPNVYCVSSGGLRVFDNGTHFNAASQITLGQRFAEAALHHTNAGPVPPPTTMPATSPTTAQASTEPAP